MASPSDKTPSVTIETPRFFFLDTTLGAFGFMNPDPVTFRPSGPVPALSSDDSRDVCRSNGNVVVINSDVVSPELRPVSWPGGRGTFGCGVVVMWFLRGDPGAGDA